MWGLLRNIGDVAGRVFLHLLAIAILYPILVIATGLGWNAASWWWFPFHLVAAAVIFAGGIIILNGLNFPLLGLLVCFGGAFSLLGVFDFLKPLGMGIGLFGAGAADIILGLYAFFGVGIFEGAIALAPGETLTVEAAQARARAALRGFVAVAAFQWAAGLFMFFFGRGVSWHLGWMLIFSTSVLAHAMLAWNVGGRWGRSIITWGAGFSFAITTYLVFVHVGDVAGWWETGTWQSFQPFVVMLVPLTFWLALTWLRRGWIARQILAVLVVILITRGFLLLLPPTTGEALMGRSFYSVLHLGTPDPGFGRMERALRQREAQLLRERLALIEGRIARVRTLEELEQIREEARPYQQWWGRGKEGLHHAKPPAGVKEGGLEIGPPLLGNLTRLMDEAERRIRKMQDP